jgi:hypothetical protein
MPEIVENTLSNGSEGFMQENFSCVSVNIWHV